MPAADMKEKVLPWQEPLDLARNVTDTRWMLFYSGLRTNYSGRYSFLCLNPLEVVEAEHFNALEKGLDTGHAWYQNAWFGYLGYGLKHDVETFCEDLPGWIALPNLIMAKFGTILRFDHELKELCCFGDIPTLPTSELHPLANITELFSNMSKAEYLYAVERVINDIHTGRLYQANVTRKFCGTFENRPHGFALFEKLCGVSPAAYSAYLCWDDIAIVSSSPEQFLTIQVDGLITTRPIKGSAGRFTDPLQDKQAQDKLLNSAKDQAENLMIVDLMRNDLARSCESGSITVEKLFELTSHATVHHLSSTVSGRKRKDVSILEVVKQCFPPGSMTGAPKIEAITLCNEVERQARGIYSGAIGWFGGDGSADLSVVIRTLIVQGNKFEFQVGGGIVADSKPEEEWAETLVKARGIAKALGILMERLEAL